MSAVGFFAECPDCGGHRYRLPDPYVNGRGQRLEAWACDGCPGEDALLCSVDLDLEAGEQVSPRPDGTGRVALYIYLADETDDEGDE
jgi:hypothetical protein